MRLLALLVLLLPLSGCMGGDLESPLPDGYRPWTSVPCDPYPQDRIPVNAHLVPPLVGSLSDVAPRVAAALGQASVVANRTEAGGEGGLLTVPASYRWDTPGGRLTHESILFGPVENAFPLMVHDLSTVEDPDTADATGTWTHETTAASLPDEATLEETLRSTYSALGADPDSLHFWLWVYNETSHEPHHDEARAVVQQWFGNFTTAPAWWTWNVEPDGGVTVQQSVGPLFVFDDVPWTEGEDLLERMRLFTECLLADDPSVHPDDLGYRLQDAFVANGTAIVEAVAYWVEAPCDTYPVLFTYLDAQTGVVYATPDVVEATCPFLDEEDW